MPNESIVSLLEDMEMLEESSNEPMAYVKQSEKRVDLRKELNGDYEPEIVETAMEEVREGNYEQAYEILGLA